jgi:hypothetical protein
MDDSFVFAGGGSFRYFRIGHPQGWLELLAEENSDTGTGPADDGRIPVPIRYTAG